MRVDCEWQGNAVNIKWFDTIGSPYSTEWRDFRDDLELVFGVESVDMSRYSATLTLASHLEIRSAALQAELAEVITKHLHTPEWAIQWA